MFEYPFQELMGINVYDYTLSEKSKKNDPEQLNMLEAVQTFPWLIIKSTKENFSSLQDLKSCILWTLLP